MLVLDEATSALDTPTERAVLASLAKFRAHEILIVISDRIASVHLRGWTTSRCLIEAVLSLQASIRHCILNPPSTAPFYNASAQDLSVP